MPIFPPGDPNINNPLNTPTQVSRWRQGGRPATLQDVWQFPDPAISWRWFVLITKYSPWRNTGQQIAYNMELAYDLGNATAASLIGDLNPFYIEKIPLVTQKIDSTPRTQGFRHDFYPGFVNLDTMSITFYEDKDFTTYQYLQNWKESIVDCFGTYGTPNNYKRNIMLWVYDVCGNVSFSTTYFDVWPSDIGTIELGTDSQRITITSTFNVAYMQPLNDGKVIHTLPRPEKPKPPTTGGPEPKPVPKPPSGT